MCQKFLCVLALLLSMASYPLQAYDGPSPLDHVKERYRAITYLSADITQKKSSQWLERPLTSTARLSLRSGVVTWQTLSPVASEITIANGRVELKGGAKGESVLPQSADTDALFALIGALVKADWEFIERECELKATGEFKLQAVPRKSSTLRLLNAVEFEFHQNYDINRIVITSKDEVTELTLAKLKFGRDS